MMPQCEYSIGIRAVNPAVIAAERKTFLDFDPFQTSWFPQRMPRYLEYGWRSNTVGDHLMLKPGEQDAYIHGDITSLTRQGLFVPAILSHLRQMGTIFHHKDGVLTYEGGDALPIRIVVTDALNIHNTTLGSWGLRFDSRKPQGIDIFRAGVGRMNPQVYALGRV